MWQKTTSRNQFPSLIPLLNSSKPENTMNKTMESSPPNLGLEEAIHQARRNNNQPSHIQTQTTTIWALREHPTKAFTMGYTYETMTKDEGGTSVKDMPMKNLQKHAFPRLKIIHNLHNNTLFISHNNIKYIGKQGPIHLVFFPLLHEKRFYTSMESKLTPSPIHGHFFSI